MFGCRFSEISYLEIPVPFHWQGIYLSYIDHSAYEQF